MNCIEKSPYKELMKTMEECNFSNNCKFAPNEKNKEFTCQAFWNLNNDPKRLNKKSPTIKIVVPKVAIESLEGCTPSQLEESLKKIQNHINNKLKNFNPEHDTEIPEPVIWEITTEIFCEEVLL